MTYELWDKQTSVNGKEAIEIIGQEQMENDDQFILFKDDTGAVIAIESVNTIKDSYGLTGDTWEEVAQAYLTYKASETLPKTPQEEITESKEKITLLEQAITELTIFMAGGVA